MLGDIKALIRDHENGELSKSDMVKYIRNRIEEHWNIHSPGHSHMKREFIGIFEGDNLQILKESAMDCATDAAKEHFCSIYVYDFGKDQVQSNYKYRNLPCTEGKWYVSGTHKIEFSGLGGSGILEWCYDENDATHIMEKMEKTGEFSNLKIGEWAE
jgi:hypothetical protein